MRLQGTRRAMTHAKNVYALMLALVIVLSGCFGLGSGDAEAEEDAATVINNYSWNNTTNVIENTPEIFTSTTNGTVSGASVNISQSAGEAIHLLGVTGTLSNGEQGVWDRYYRIQTDCGDIHLTDGSLDSLSVGNDRWLGGGGLECTHEVTTSGGGFSAAQWKITSVSYLRVPATVV